jgi:AAA family ATP:ADP antiporter
MVGNLFLLLVAYYVIKTAREPLILATGGAELKAYAAAGQALTLMAFVPFYGWLASRVEPIRLITWILLFFAACLELFNLGLRLDVPNLGFVFYVFVGIYSLATVAQFWSFANDIYRLDVGERLFPIIAIGANAGSPVGAKLAGLLIRAGVTPANMLHATAVMLLLHLAIYNLVLRHGNTGKSPVRDPLAGPGGFQLVFQSRYLRLIAVLYILLNIVLSIGEYLISRSVLLAAATATAADPRIHKAAFIGGFYADYFLWVDILALGLQALLASRLIRHFGLGGVLFALPLFSLGAYGMAAVGVGFGLFRWAKTAENATNYSIMNTARQLLWLPARREEKYKAKQALDTFFVRFGDVLAAALVFVCTTRLHWDVRGFSGLNIVLVLASIAVAVLVLRENRTLIQRKEVH